MRYFSAIMFFSLSMSAYASPSAPTPAEFQELLQLDYKAFDQTLPAGGWRAIADEVDCGQILDAYNVQNADRLSKSENRIIYWHAGQSYAMAGLKKLAAARFKKSFDESEQPNDRFKWNAYVDASIAFLEQDKPRLLKARDLLRKAPDSPMNLKIVESFVRCFGKSYREAYDPSCE